VRDRLDTPSVGEAVLCGVLLLVIQFFAIMIPPPQGWNQFVITTLVLQVALIATPACLMAIMLTRNPAKTLSLGRPSFLLTLPAAVLLAACLHPATSWLSEAIRYVYPLNPSIVEKLEQFATYASTEPLWQVLLLIAVTPAVCEELAFRGFILSGLRHMGHKWAAIGLAAVFFGLAHGLLQQSLAACAIGVVIGYVAVKTGSLWPGMLFHMTHNGLSVLHTRLTPELHDSQPLLRMLLVADQRTGELHYSIVASALLGLLAAAILWWFKSLPYHASAEERLQDALDHQVALPAKTPA
jgi:sodium transport system permease protein